MPKYFKLSRYELLRGDFPVNHDSVLKVVYSECFQYFTCKNEDASLFVSIVSSLMAVRSVEISSVDDFELIDFDKSKMSTKAQQILKDYV